jgi:hypothetical protein
LLRDNARGTFNISVRRVAKDLIEAKPPSVRRPSTQVSASSPPSLVASR